MKPKKNPACFRPYGFVHKRKGLEGARPPARADLLLLCASALVFACGYGAAAQAAPKLKTLFSFANLKGSYPYAGLIVDAAGNFYGTTAGGGAYGNAGVVFELSPPTARNKHWTEKVLHSFNGNDGSEPFAGLISDGAGNLYGTTSLAAPTTGGVVFKLSPPAPGAAHWTETVLQAFRSGNNNYLNGYQPVAGLIADGAGNLYGTTLYGGTNGEGNVFELSPPPAGKTAWAEAVLYSFGPNDQYPAAGLIADGAGNLFGTTFGGVSSYGDVFELSPPAKGQTAWTETVLASFSGVNIPCLGENPAAGLIADAAGNLYGTTEIGGEFNGGEVFELSPPAKGQTAWTETVLLSFSGGESGKTTGIYPVAGVIADGAGNLYGTTKQGGANLDGVVFELSPPAKGQTAWTETVLKSFNGADGKNPQAGLIADGAGSFYGTTAYGGANGDGVVFKLTP